MPDFRRVAINALKWFPQSRKAVPVTPVRVQVPPAACSVALLAGRYSLDLTLAGHATHASFVRFLADLEAHAREHAHPTAEGLSWFSCVDADSLVPSFKLSAFDDAKFFDHAGAPHHAPTDLEACACLVELTGAWTSDSHWGLRWKVVEVKEVRRQLRVPCFLLDDD